MEERTILLSDNKNFVYLAITNIVNFILRVTDSDFPAIEWILSTMSDPSRAA